ncbi:MAG: MotA/TolQ/ExbB proton channel family protein [Ottowia sp.]|nr:MotA/TolQ/ExbB proton channel family protein [Ottowia sp.]
MNTQFGLAHVWAQGDTVSRAVFVLLMAMSLVSWLVIALKALAVLRARRQAGRVPGFWRSASMDDGLKHLGSEEDNPFRQLALEGRAASAVLQDGGKAQQLGQRIDASDWIAAALHSSLDAAAMRQQAGLAILASIGATAPFIGLFGTVWGIYHALMGISAAGNATIDQVAGPIGEALIMTATGLAVAIPAVLGYNALLRGNKGVHARLRRFAHELHSFLLTGVRQGGRAA